MGNASSFAPAHLSGIDLRMAEAQASGVAFQSTDDDTFTGRFLGFEGRQLLNFVCCSYLGLEQREDLKRAAISAIERQGVQFSCSRAVLQSSQYNELEAALSEMTGGHAIVSATTTLTHIAAMPVLIGPGDAVLIDQQAHASLHTASALLRVPMEVVRHNRIDQLEQRVQELSLKHERVWYILDGVYSMYGDFAPIDALRDLLERYPALHLYVDDAHSTSWAGTHGRGYALERFPDRSRVVGVLSLNKAFSAGGGALIVPDEQVAQRVRANWRPVGVQRPASTSTIGGSTRFRKASLEPRAARPAGRPRATDETLHSALR